MSALRTARRTAAAAALLAVVFAALSLRAARADEGPAAAPFRGETHVLRRLELREARVIDAVRLVSEVSGLNVVATGEAGERKVTLYVRDVSAGMAVEILCKVAGLWYRRDPDTQTFRVMTTEEYQKDHVVYRKDDIRVFTLQHPNAIVVGTALEDLYGDRVALSLGVEEEEATDLPGGIGGGRGGDAGGLGAFDRQRPLYEGERSRDRLLRRSGSGGALRGRSAPSERVVEETLTPDQIARLEAAARAGLALTAEELLGITRRDPPIYVTVNRQHNLIVVRTSDSTAMRQIEQLVVELDRPTPQVLLEMRILALNRGDSFRSIFDLELVGGPSTSGPASAQPANPLLPLAPTASRNVLGLGNFPLEDSRLVYQFLSDTFRARLQLLAEDHRVHVLSTPIVLASNNRPARMFVGEERVLVTGVNTDIVTPATGATTSAIQPVTEVRDVGNTLLVVPKINADRTVTLYIVQDTSSVNPRSATIPVAAADGSIREFPIDTVNTANLEVTVVAKDGMTLAVGGLIRSERTNREEKVPVLGDLPVVNPLFRRTVRENLHSELILLIKPRVVFTPAEADAATRRRLGARSCDPCVQEDIAEPVLVAPPPPSALPPAPPLPLWEVIR